VYKTHQTEHDQMEWTVNYCHEVELQISIWGNKVSLFYSAKP